MMMISKWQRRRRQATHKVLPLLDTTCSATTVAGCCVWVLDFVWWCRRLHYYLWIRINNLGGGYLLDPKGFRIFGISFGIYQKSFCNFWIQKVSWSWSFIQKVSYLSAAPVRRRPPPAKLSPSVYNLCIPVHTLPLHYIQARKTVGGEFIIVGSSVPVRRKSRK